MLFILSKPGGDTRKLAIINLIDKGLDKPLVLKKSPISFLSETSCSVNTESDDNDLIWSAVADPREVFHRNSS